MTLINSRWTAVALATGLAVGAERNFVVTLRDWMNEKQYLHDLISTDRRYPGTLGTFWERHLGFLPSVVSRFAVRRSRDAAPERGLRA